MGQLREQLLEMIDSSNPSPSLSYWNKFLNFFSDNKDQLNTQDMEILCAECERCRAYWNEDRIEIMRLQRAGGEVDQEKVIKGLGINREDVYPKIYDHLEMLRREDELAAEQEAKELEKTAVTTEVIPEAIPLAAAPA